MKIANIAGSTFASSAIFCISSSLTLPASILPKLLLKQPDVFRLKNEIHGEMRAFRPTVGGRALERADFRAESRSVVVNEAFVDRVLGGRNAVGGQIRFPERVLSTFI